MAFNKKTIKDIELTGKKILLRADFNVSLNHAGKVISDYRIRKALPTIKYLLDNGVASIGIISHLGRPNGKVDPSFSLRSVAQLLSELLNQTVEFIDDCTKRPEGQSKIVLFENVRFYKEETDNSAVFARQLAAGFDVFVEDGFGVVHRQQSSVTGVANLLPSVAGLLVEHEVRTITETINNPIQPFIAVLGGAKIADKIDLINHLIHKNVDHFLITGAMANTFLAARGLGVGASKYEQGHLDIAKQISSNIAQHGKQLTLPDIDVAVAKEMAPGAQRREINLDQVEPDDIILDIGSQSLKVFINAIQEANTVLWNGTFGVTELPAFRKASEEFAKALAGAKAKTLIGGGDTSGFIDEIGMTADFNHVSTGGGASLELIAGKNLPGIDVLLDK